MKARELIEHLQRLHPDTEVLPLWEMHCPGDFGGFVRGSVDDLWPQLRAEKAGARALVFIDCEGAEDEPNWHPWLPPEALA